jgi:hypothetical protein
MASYKIINLSTGRCYNHNLPNFEHDLSEIVYSNRMDAELDLEHIIKINAVLSNHKVRPEHLEIIRVDNS